MKNEDRPEMAMKIVSPEMANAMKSNDGIDIQEMESIAQVEEDHMLAMRAGESNKENSKIDHGAGESTSVEDRFAVELNGVGAKVQAKNEWKKIVDEEMDRMIKLEVCKDDGVEEELSLFDENCAEEELSVGSDVESVMESRFENSAVDDLKSKFVELMKKEEEEALKTEQWPSVEAMWSDVFTKNLSREKFEKQVEVFVGNKSVRNVFDDGG